MPFRGAGWVFPVAGILCYNGSQSCRAREDGERVSTQPTEQRQLDQYDEIAELWYNAIATFGFSTRSTREVRRELRELTERAIRFFAAAQPDSADAEELGASLVRLHFIQAEALDGTLRVLVEQLSTLRPAGGELEYQDRLAVLLRGISTGFNREACKVVLAEQESIRAALLAEIRASGRALREAYAELEQRVKDRTAELAEANRELRASEEKYRRLVEEMQEVVYVVDQKGELIYVSPSVEELLGYKPEEMLGNAFARFVFPEDLSRAQEGFERVQAGVMATSEYRVLTKEGEIRWGRVSSSPVLEDGRVAGIRGLLADVTESRQAREALQASEERWRLLVENAPVLVATVTPDFRVRFINRVPGQEASQVAVVGVEALAFAAPSHRDAAAAAIRRAFETGDSEYLELPVVSSRRRDAWYGLHLGPLRREGRVAEVMLVAVDVTEERRIAEMKDNLIRDVSHELRTPLAKVQMSLDLLVELMEKEDLDRERAIRVSGFATRSTERMLRTVEDILDLTRLEAGTWVDDQQVFRPEALINEAVMYARPLSSPQGLEVEADLPESLPTIRADWDKLYRVLRNLLVNAIKFSEKGKVTVTAEDRGVELVIGVHDQGQGINPGNLERIFDRFFQEKTRHLGAGLGLAICRTIVEEYGGRIWAESRGRGQGASFWFTVPTEAAEE